MTTAAPRDSDQSICLTPPWVPKAGWAVRFFRPFTPLLLGWLISFAAWGTIATVLGVNVMGRGGDFWSVAVKFGLRDWAPWAILTPLLFRFVNRFPIEKRRWFVLWPLHLFLFVSTMAAILGWKNGVEWIYARTMPSPSAPSFFLKPGDGSLPPPLFPGGMAGPPPFDLFHYISFEIPVYLVILSGAHLMLYRRRLEERAASLTRARLDALRTQLQPHFLFNTLNAIAGMVHEKPDKADAMLVALSDLLRMSLETSSEVELPLSRELEYLDRYFAIIVTRFEERIGYILDVDEASKIALVPVFILQPLVENAVQHGLQPRPEGGVVTVQARREGAILRITVSDDGVGFRHTENASEGIGLGNARARLKELYGNRASLEMYDGPQTQVIIEMPYRAAV